MKIANQALISNSKNNEGSHFTSKLQAPSNQQSQNIQNIYKQFSQSRTLKLQKKFIWSIFELCYNNVHRQKSIAEYLKFPFITGPISLNPIPISLLKHNQNLNQKKQTLQPSPSQLQFLFTYLKNVKEYYFCWVIYFNQELKVLNVKLFKRQEIRDHQQLFNPQLNLIGIFINRNKNHPLNCDKETPVCKKQQQEEVQFYEKDRCQTNINTKSTQSLNNSTGTTFKISCFKDHVINELEGPLKGDFKKNKLKIRSISPKLKLLTSNKESKGLSFMKRDENVSKYQKKDEVNSTIFTRSQAKQKSKSYIQLLRSKSNKLKQVNFESQKIDNPFLKQISNGNKAKTKLRKESKIKKIEQIYYKPSFKRAFHETK